MNQKGGTVWEINRIIKLNQSNKLRQQFKSRNNEFLEEDWEDGIGRKFHTKREENVRENILTQN